MTNAELCRLEQAELIKLIEEGELVYIGIDLASGKDMTSYATPEQAKQKLKELTK